MAFKAYLGELQKYLKSGQATEPTYYPSLERLLEALDSKVEVICQPKHIEAGNPDFRVQRRGQAIDFPVGLVEAKDIGEDLGKVEKTDQLKRYRGFPNLVLTDFLEFRWYTDGDRRMTARLGTRVGRKIKIDPKGEGKVRELLVGFLRHSIPRSAPRRNSHYAWPASPI